MKTKYFFIAFFLLISQVVFSQNDTITGILFNVNNKPIKRYTVTLGKQSPVRVKTDRKGIFSFQNANLHDTLYVADKRGRNAVAVPVNGFNFVAIQSKTGNFNRQFRSDADNLLIRHLEQEILLQAIMRPRDFSTLDREDIANSGCKDVECLLHKFSGLKMTYFNGVVRFIEIRGVKTFGGNINPLIVVDGISHEADSDLSALLSIPIIEIEKITIIKDASMYGVKGMNGAIVVSTF